MSTKKTNNDVSLILAGKRLRHLREDMGMSRQEFAQRLGLTANKIKARELGNSSVTAQDIRLLYLEFGTDPEFITTGSGKMFDPKKAWRDKITATFTPRTGKKYTDKATAPTEIITWLKWIIEWMDREFSGPGGDGRAMAFFDLLRKINQNFDDFVKEKLDGAYSNAADNKRNTGTRG
jgi:transcriptional regulator with XRE-family HTH domain